MDGQKAALKGRLVARTFHEQKSPQSESPTVLRDSLKFYFSVATNEGFGLRSIDIRAVLLQTKVLDRDVFMEPPRDVESDGKIWKLKKPLCGLNDASYKFWLNLREVFD